MGAVDLMEKSTKTPGTDRQVSSIAPNVHHSLLLSCQVGGGERKPNPDASYEDVNLFNIKQQKISRCGEARPKKTRDKTRPQTESSKQAK